MTLLDPRELSLRRLYSTFPGGSHGIGLMLLRVAIGGTPSCKVRPICLTLGDCDLRCGPSACWRSQVVRRFSLDF